MENHTKRMRKARRQGMAAVGRDIETGPRIPLRESGRLPAGLETRRRPVAGKGSRKTADLRRRRSTKG